MTLRLIFLHNIKSSSFWPKTKKILIIWRNSKNCIGDCFEGFWRWVYI